VPLGSSSLIAAEDRRIYTKVQSKTPLPPTMTSFQNGLGFTLLQHPTSQALPTSPTPHQAELVCWACTGTTQNMHWEALSMSPAAYDPRLLSEQETPLVIEKNWFLDQEIPTGGFVRIQDSSQTWEERVDKTRITTMESLTFTCLDSGRGWTMNSEG